MKKSLLGVASLFLVLAAHGTAKADTGQVIFEDWVKFKGMGSGTPDLNLEVCSYSKRYVYE